MVQYLVGMELEIKGHSGCQVDVVTEDGQVYVYKSTIDPRYLNRLALQGKKQIEAGKSEYQHIRVPKVFELIETADRTSLKMQYVYSKNFIEFFEQAGFEQVDYFIGALEYFIEKELKTCEMKNISAQVFKDKFEDIKRKVFSNPIYNENNAISGIFKRCHDVFYSLSDMIIPVGTCHGDLTFSNILFNGNNYYLIDFLDSFIETPLQDIVKIRQDTAYRWSQLMYIRKYDAVRLRIVCDKIDSEIDRYFAGRYQWYRENYQVMQLMNILRILPYAKEKEVIYYLQDILTNLLNEIN